MNIQVVLLSRITRLSMAMLKGWLLARQEVHMLLFTSLYVDTDVTELALNPTVSL